MKTAEKTVLVVEDSEDDADLIRLAFRKMGFANPFHAVAQPKEAIRYLEGQGQYADRSKFAFPHLILLDHRMPGDGWVVIEWVRKRPELESLPLVVFSGSDDPNHQKKACALGANEYRIKPSNYGEFKDAVKKIAEDWLGKR